MRMIEFWNKSSIWNFRCVSCKQVDCWFSQCVCSRFYQARSSQSCVLCNRLNSQRSHAPHHPAASPAPLCPARPLRRRRRPSALPSQRRGEAGRQAGRGLRARLPRRLHQGAHCEYLCVVKFKIAWVETFLRLFVSFPSQILVLTHYV